MNIIRPSTIAGVMELLPYEQLVFDKMKNTIEETFKEYQFLPIDTPVIEKNEILFAKGGGETEKQIYEIASDTRDMSLRFDLTVPLARYVAEHFSDLNFPFKRYHIAKVYRGERNQKGRYREFYQADIDIVGHNDLSIYNDAILPKVMYSVFQRLDFPNITFHINNRKLLNGFFNSLNINDATEILRAIDKKEKIGNEKLEEILIEIMGEDNTKTTMSFLDTKESNINLLKNLDEFDGNDLYKEGIAELNTVYEYMIKLGIPDQNIKIDLSITRGLDYYTSTVYETFINGYEKLGSVCSGGRYDNLAGNFTKQHLPGVGMSIGLTRLFYQFMELGLIDNNKMTLTDILILPMEVSYNMYAIDTFDKLKENGMNADIYLENDKFKKKMNYADKIKVKYVVIIGENEYKNDEITIKNMEEGSQETIKIEQISDYFS